jgi:hypothetical protein
MKVILVVLTPGCYACAYWMYVLSHPTLHVRIEVGRVLKIAIAWALSSTPRFNTQCMCGWVRIYVEYPFYM